MGKHGSMGVAGAEGGVELESLRASWDLTFGAPEPPMFHLPKQCMYTAPVPRTKSISAAPMLHLAGSLDVDGQPVDVDGWPCTIGHNWGAEHAERWIWIHADAEADDGPVWLDAIIGRIRLGPVTTPWIANGAVSIAGRRHRLGGLRFGVGTTVTEHDRGATVRLRGRDLSVEFRSEVGTTLHIERSEGATLGATAPVSAFEIGGRRRALDVPLQPFPD